MNRRFFNGKSFGEFLTNKKCAVFLLQKCKPSVCCRKILLSRTANTPRGTVFADSFKCYAVAAGLVDQSRAADRRQPNYKEIVYGLHFS